MKITSLFPLTILHLFLYHRLYLMQCNSHIIRLNKVAPVAVGLAAAGIKVVLLYLVPNSDNLLGNGGNILRLYNNFPAQVLSFFIRLNKVKLKAYCIPLPACIMV